jgi:hypothetical protein
VHSVSIHDKAEIQEFFRNDPRNSLLVCGESEKALTSLPEGTFPNVRDLAEI